MLFFNKTLDNCFHVCSDGTGFPTEQPMAKACHLVQPPAAYFSAREAEKYAKAALVGLLKTCASPRGAFNGLYWCRLSHDTHLSRTIIRAARHWVARVPPSVLAFLVRCGFSVPAAGDHAGSPLQAFLKTESFDTKRSVAFSLQSLLFL